MLKKSVKVFSRTKKTLHGSGDPSADVGVVIFVELCQSKVRYLGVKILIEQHIAGLDVPMNNFYSGLFMEKSQTPCYADANFLPGRPV